MIHTATNTHKLINLEREHQIALTGVACLMWNLLNIKLMKETNQSCSILIALPPPHSNRLTLLYNRFYKHTCTCPSGNFSVLSEQVWPFLWWSVIAASHTFYFVSQHAKTLTHTHTHTHNEFCVLLCIVSYLSAVSCKTFTLLPQS